MDTKSLTRTLAARLEAPLWTGAILRGRVRPFRLGHCPLCGTCVRVDDVLTVIGFHVAHAECSLVRARRFRSGRR